MTDIPDQPTGDFEFNSLNDLTDVTMISSSGEQSYIYSGTTLTWDSTESSISWSTDNKDLQEAMNMLQRQKECRIPTFKDLDDTEQSRLEQIMQSDTVYVREIRPDMEVIKTSNNANEKKNFEIYDFILKYLNH